MMTKAYKEGRAAWRHDGGSTTDCHYCLGSKAWQDWFRGYAAIPARAIKRKSSGETEAEETAWQWFAEAHPHEAHATWPDRFWRYFQKQRPGISRDKMRQLLLETEKGTP